MLRKNTLIWQIRSTHQNTFIDVYVSSSNIYRAKKNGYERRLKKICEKSAIFENCYRRLFVKRAAKHSSAGKARPPHPHLDALHILAEPSFSGAENSYLVVHLIKTCPIHQSLPIPDPFSVTTVLLIQPPPIHADKCAVTPVIKWHFLPSLHHRVLFETSFFFQPPSPRIFTSILIIFLTRYQVSTIKKRGKSEKTKFFFVFTTLWRTTLKVSVNDNFTLSPSHSFVDRV